MIPFLGRLTMVSAAVVLSCQVSEAAFIPEAVITARQDTAAAGAREVGFEAVIATGELEGRSVRVDVHHYGHPQFDPVLSPGDAVVLRIETDPQSGEILHTSFAQYRLWPFLVSLVCAFTLAVGLTAGPAGLRGLVGTGFSMAALVGALALSLRFGVSPILAVLGAGLLAAVLSISFLFRGQPRARRLARWSIACSFTANSALAVGLVQFLKLDGQSLDGARDVILSYHMGLARLAPDQFWQILAAALPIATLGAVFDSAVVLAVSLDELCRTSADPPTPTALSESASRIGRDLFTTLFLTLFFAHLGIFAPFWAVAFMTDAPLLFLLNSEWLSIGLAHVTSSAAGLMFSVFATRKLAPKALLG